MAPSSPRVSPGLSPSGGAGRPCPGPGRLGMQPRLGWNRAAGAASPGASLALAHPSIPPARRSAPAAFVVRQPERSWSRSPSMEPLSHRGLPRLSWIDTLYSSMWGRGAGPEPPGQGRGTGCACPTVPGPGGRWAAQSRCLLGAGGPHLPPGAAALLRPCSAAWPGGSWLHNGEEGDSSVPPARAPGPFLRQGRHGGCPTACPACATGELGAGPDFPPLSVPWPTAPRTSGLQRLSKAGGLPLG